MRGLIAHLVNYSLPGNDIQEFAAQFGGGTSPADIVAWVEQAKAAADEANQRLGRIHLQNALEQITGIETISPGRIFRIAVHELGHAAVARSLYGPEALQSVSVRPTLSGSIGGIRLTPIKATPARGVWIDSQASWIDEISMLMGGYAAERLFLAGHGGASLRAGDDVKRARAIATEMMASGLGATTNPASRPFSALHPGQVDEILNQAYSRAETVMQAVTRQEMFAAANQLSSLGFVSGEVLQTLMAKLQHSTESAQANTPRMGDSSPPVPHEIRE